jgi:localization factor PodJL
MSGDAAERIAEALEHFRHAGDALSGKIERAEQAFDEAKADISSVKRRLETQVTVAEEVARRAEAAVSFLSTDLESRDEALAQTLAQAKSVAEAAARQAGEASADAIAELRRLQEHMTERLAETESSTRRAVASAIDEVRAEQATETRSTREALLEEVVRLESEIATRVSFVDQIKEDQSALISRIEQAEAGAREATAGLRQAAGAAIADLRNAQLTITARLKQVEDAGPGADLQGIRQHQQDIAERLAALEKKTEASPVTDALAAFERRIAGLERGGAQKIGEVDGAVKTLDEALQRLSARMAETESTANTAIRTLEETVSSLGARVEQSNAAQETEALRAMLEQRLDNMAQSVQQMVGEARTELSGQLQAAMQGAHAEGLEEALADVNRRLAAAERRQAQTIEAISLEIKRMSETVDKRLRTVESRNDDAAASAVREELARMSTTLEARFDEIERREAAAFDRMGLEVGRLSERLEERVGAVEHRSAQAIEQVGEQVARMAERFNQRHDMLARDLSERMLDSEERAGARVTEAIGSIMQRLAEVEQHSAEAIAPVQKAVSSVATKLDQIESAHEHAHDPLDHYPASPRAHDDFSAFGELEPAASPMDVAKPVHAGPLPPFSPRVSDPVPPPAEDDDLYLEDNANAVAAPALDADVFDTPEAEQSTPPMPPAPEFKSFGTSDDDDLLVEDRDDEEPDAFAPTPLEDDPFWTPEHTNDASSHADAAIADAAMLDFDPQSEPLDLNTEPPAPAPPPGKNDYLANARRAAQAQSLPKTRSEPGPTPTLSLRGSSRIVLWGAAGGLALLVLGGAYFFGGRTAPHPPAPSPSPPPTSPAPTINDAQPDPFATAAPTSDGADETAKDAAPLPTGSASSPPPGQAQPAQANPASAPVVAGPMPPRSVSLNQAAQSGDPVAQYELALQRLSAGQTALGITLLRSAANQGLSMAQYRMAKVYERGEGVAVDLNTARQWTERAAAGGNRRAMHDLGVYYARGDGAPLDEAAAFRWFRQAAELGVSDSQYNLGVLYQQGRGVNASATEALFWFSVAALQGDTDAAARAAALEAQLTPAQVQQARARAQAFRPRAASAIANGDFGSRASSPAPQRHGGA